MLLICAVSAASLAAQTRKPIPLPIIDSRAIAPTQREPLTSAEKAKLALRNTFGPRALGNRIVAAGFDQLRGHPEEWGGGMEGYGMRFGSRMGRLAIRNSIRLTTDVAFGLEPRYDRCDCTGFLKRTGHALKRVVVARTDAGGEAFHVTNFAGAYVTPMITYPAWYPDRLNTWNRKVESGTFHLGWRGVTNMIREFWPEMRRGATGGRSKN
jgi:hypothetical protein